MAHLSLEPILSVSMELYQSRFGPVEGRVETKLDASSDIVLHQGLYSLYVHVKVMNSFISEFVKPFVSVSFSNSIVPLREIEQYSKFEAVQ